MSRRLLPLVELASVLLTLSVVIGFNRLFDDDSFLGPLVVIALVTHAISIVLRRAGRGLSVTALVSLATLAALITVQHYSDTARAFIPTGESRAALRVDLRVAWDTFGEVSAPTEALVGFVVLASIGIWLSAFLVDWAAFRLGSKIETLLPPAALFGFQAVVGGDRARILSAVCFGAAAVFFVLAHRVATLEKSGRWLNDEGGQGRVALLRGGAAVSLLAIVVGLGVGPLLPGADDEALVQLEPSEGGDGTRWVENPLVNIRSRLFEQSEDVMFTVNTTAQPEYWRMAALHEFDGEQWSTTDNYTSADAELASTRPDELGSERMNQRFTIINLISNWMPAAYEANLVEAPDFTPSWSEQAGVLLMPDDRPLGPKDYYTVVSQVPDRDLAAVAAADGDIPPEIADLHLDLPADFPQAVRDEAQRIVTEAGASTPYEKALALQDYFLAEFTYDIEVAAGHSQADIEEFLLSLRRGYCEQFAGSYAAMARSLGLPARVAVGFTPGDIDPEFGVYVVRGTHAHAWPEVWFPDAGWVRFEPTPGRGLARDEPLTGVEPVAPGQTELDPEESEGVPVPTTLPPPTATEPTQPVPAEAAAGVPFTGFRASSGVSPWLLVSLLALVLLGGAALLVLMRRRRRDRGPRRDEPARVQVNRAWDDAADGLAMVGTRANPAETVNEFSQRAAERVDDTAGRELVELAQLATAARYAGEDLQVETGEHARQLAQGVRGYCNGVVTRRRRLAWEMRPFRSRTRGSRPSKSSA